MLNRWWPRAAAAAQLAIFLVMERALRRGPEAQSMDRLEHDRGSTMGIGIAFGFAMTAPFATSFLKRGRLSVTTGWGGATAMTAGLALRWWAARTLGDSYTRTLRVREAQRVVDSGPYALVLHPGYAADILMWLGYGLAWTNVAAVFATTVPLTLAYSYRIAVEEIMLREQMGPEYERYAARTARLIPGVY
jgi:protein-S-isoprenylcysteine O-methyltransferase Ste14